MNIVHTPNHYLIILDGVPHGKLIPLHLPSFSAYNYKAFKTIAMIVLDVLGYFNRNKQNSYAALILRWIIITYNNITWWYWD